MRQQAPWTSEDVTAVQTIGNILGPVRVLSHEETRMTTETAPADFTGGDDNGWAEATGGNAPVFPEAPDNPHEAPLSVNFKPGGTPQLTVRGRTVQEHMDLLQQVQSSGLLALVNAVSSAFGGQGGAPAPQAPANPFNQQPAQPFPNQPFPGQPAWQQAGAPQAQAPQWGGGQQAAPQGNRQGPKPRPNWPQVYKIDVPFPMKDAFKAFREENKEILKGKVAWAGGGGYWVEGSVVQGFAQFNPVAA